jgi:hypothetical protein
VQVDSRLHNPPPSIFLVLGATLKGVSSLYFTAPSRAFNIDKSLQLDTHICIAKLLWRYIAMNNASAVVLMGLTLWTLLLLILMEALRTRYVLTKAVAANEFRSDNSNLSPFMQRLARAHANCVESLPILAFS